MALALLGAPGGELRAEQSPPPIADYRLPWPEGKTNMFIHGKGANPHFHKRDLHAVDIALGEGTPVLAAREGVVDSVEDQQGRGEDEEQPATFEGNYVRVRHADDTYATYAHLAREGVRVRPGDRVTAGQLLGYSGSSGEVARAQLHFGVSRFEKNAAGRWEELSLPFAFSVGLPPYRFEARAHMLVTPVYDGPAERPHYADGMPRGYERPELTAEEEMRAWLHIVVFLLFGLAMMVGTAWPCLATGRGGTGEWRARQ